MLSADTSWKLVAIAAALVAAVTWLVAGHQAAQAGDTDGGGACVMTGQGGELNCLDVYLEGDNLSSQKSFQVRGATATGTWIPASYFGTTYEDALDDAEHNWGKAVGPQAPAESCGLAFAPHPLPCFTNVYVNCDTPPATMNDPGGLCDERGNPNDIPLAYVCRTYLFAGQEEVDCISEASSVAIRTVTYVNDSFLSGQSHAVKVNVIAHELGHTLGLDHHNEAGCLMQDATAAPQGPQACDIGQLEPCGGGVSTWGIRCIYFWFRERGVSVDCFDADRDGRTNIIDIALASDAFGTVAGQPLYRPDTDVDLNGANNIIDIGHFVVEFGHVCADHHYMGS